MDMDFGLGLLGPGPLLLGFVLGLGQLGVASLCCFYFVFMLCFC